jgi:uncharacterized protein YdeI (YjbR/CyaY-like superfamily)
MPFGRRVPRVSELHDGRPVVHPKSRKGWRQWLSRNHARSSGVWLATYKKETGKQRVDYAAAVEEALAFGWIDSKSNRLDDERSLLWMCPRKPSSGWSKSNKERVERLERQGLMTDAGRAAIETAKRSGSWTLLDAVEALEEPEDLATSLVANPAARANYEAFPPSSRKIILTWIATAKREETRRKRIDETVRLAAENVRANHGR